MLRREFLFTLPAGLAVAAKVDLPVRKVKVERAFDSPCPKPNGLECTEEGLWVLNQGGDNALYLTDYNGKLKEKLNTASVAGSGVGWDGRHLWIASTYDCNILKIDRKTGKTLAKFDTPGAGVVNWPNPRKSPLAPKEEAKPAAPAPSAAAKKAPKPRTGAHGIEFRDGKMYLAVPPSATVYRINPDPWKVEFEFKTVGDRPHGLGWEGAYLWCVDSNLNAMFKYDPKTGKALEMIQLADSDPLPHGMAIQNNRTMWYCDDVGVVCKIKL